MREKLYEQINALIDLQTRWQENFFQLLVDSEGRIESTNQMINRLSDATTNTINTLNLVAREYSSHLQGVISSRNKVQKQNIELASTVNQTSKTILHLQEQNQQLLNFILSQLSHIAPSAANITVNQQPSPI